MLRTDYRDSATNESHLLHPSMIGFSFPISADCFAALWESIISPSLLVWFFWLLTLAVIKVLWSNCFPKALTPDFVFPTEYCLTWNPKKSKPVFRWYLFRVWLILVFSGFNVNPSCESHSSITSWHLSITSRFSCITTKSSAYLTTLGLKKFIVLLVLGSWNVLVGNISCILFSNPWRAILALEWRNRTPLWCAFICRE